jgi:hypothetical protein
VGVYDEAKEGIAMTLKRMSLVVVASVALSAHSAHAAEAHNVDGGLKTQLIVNEFALKLKAGGQIDYDAGTMSLAGQSSHLGRFTGEGPFDTATSTFSGILSGSSGEWVNATIALVEQSPGEFTVSLVFVGLASYGHLTSGIGTGTLHMDQDFMFTMEIEGTMQKCRADVCLGR